MKKFLKIVAVALVVLIGALLLALNTIALRVTRSQLAANLQVPASLDGLSLSLVSGTAELRGLKIGQPEGFGEGDAVSLGRLKVDVDVSSLFGGTIRIESVALDNPGIHIVKSPEKGMNLTALARPPKDPSPPEPGEPGKPLSLLLAALDIKGGLVRYTDHTKGTNAVDIVVTNLNVALASIQLGPEAPGQPKEGSARVAFEIAQDSGTNAIAQITARIAPIRPGVEPSVAATVRLAGLELDTLGPIPGRDAIGQSIGYGLDIRIDASAAPGLLAAEGVLANEYGQEHELLKASGTVAEPAIHLNSLFTGVIAVPGKMLTAAAGNVAQAGGKAVMAVADTGEAVVVGALDTVGSLAGGLLSSGGKLLKGDISGAGGELVKGVEDTASAAAGTVTGAGSAVVGGVAGVASTAVGGEQMGEWRAALPARSSALFLEADKKLAAGPFPPVKQP